MDNAKKVLETLSEKYEICVVSLGTYSNLKLKEKWLYEKLPFLHLIGCCTDEVSNKSHIDMSDGFLIDDNIDMLRTSNAKYNIAFGKVLSWNEDWAGIRCLDWREVKKLLM